MGEDDHGALAHLEGSAVVDQHRAFAREMNQKHQRVYAMGGLLALSAAASILVAAWVTTGLAVVWPWVASPTAFLVAMLWVRRRIKATTAEHVQQVEAYCRANDLDPGALERAWREDGTYPYFVVLLESRHERVLLEH